MPSPSEEPISATLVECQRLGLSGIQVSEDGHLTGVVAREDLDRAVRHGLSHAPVKGVMSSGVDVIGADATLGELRELLATGRADRLVVVDEGPHRSEDRVPITSAHGVVTRGDLLRALHEPAALERPAAGPRGDRGRARAPPHDRAAADVLPAIVAAAAPEEGVYLVGGAVRDVLLGEQSLDLDVMVEGDAIDLARRLARELGARCHAHEKFQTAVVKGADPAGRRAANRHRHRADGVLRVPGRAARRWSARRCATTSPGATSRSTRWRPR